MFDAITSIDTLYFAEDLNTLVKKIMCWLKPHGVFATYYMDESKERHETQLAKVLCNNDISYEAIDYSESHFHIMRKKHDTAFLMREDLEKDGLAEHVKRMICESFNENITLLNSRDEYCGCRFLYIIEKGNY